MAISEQNTTNSDFIAGRITKIDQQKKNKERFSIFIDEEYAFGIHAEILSKRGIYVGQQLSHKEVLDLIKEDDQKKAKIQSLRYLSNRDHSEKELYEKLHKKGYSDSVINWVLNDLKRLNLLNDAIFAEKFARNRLIQRPFGRRKLYYDLKKKGIADSIVEDTLNKIYLEFDEESLAKQLTEKYMQSMKEDSPLKMKKKLSDSLLRKGFDWEIVQKMLEELDIQRV